MTGLLSGINCEEGLVVDSSVYNGGGNGYFNGSSND